MFFEAMKRKGYSSEARDMKTIVPIHNAVNERAWKEIKEWERPWGAEQKCVFPIYISEICANGTADVEDRDYIPSLDYRRR